jgi:DNA polymerase-3 subunit epsilon
MSTFWLTLRRWRARQRSTNPAYKAFLDRPLPAPGTPFEDAELVCMDIETTGLDPTTDRQVTSVRAHLFTG